jgi:two-component system, OmpR family, sensor histidine kinase QseC
MSKSDGGSLRLQLIGWLLFVLLLAWCATLAVSYQDARRELDSLLDAHLALSASLLVAQSEHEVDEIEVEHAPELERYGRQVAFQIWAAGDELVLRSSQSPRQRLSAEENGFSDSLADGTRWRVFSTWDANHQMLIQVGEEATTRADIVAAIGRNLLRPLLLALPILALVIWLVIGRGLRSLAALGRQVSLREPSNLTALDLTKAPREVVPLVKSLNRLFERVAASIEHERRFTADAAHELRTPIAALRAQAEVARGATTDAERSHALTQVIHACDRAARLMQQLLTLARTDPAQFAMQRVRCDLALRAKQVIAELAPATIVQHTEISLDSVGTTWVAGDPDLLRLLLRNLLDNAVCHGGGPISVSIRGAAQEAVQLTVQDHGEGVPIPERERLGERFFRPTTSAQGSGLGLSIVLRIAALHGASVHFGETAGGRGLRVMLCFPPESHTA